MIPPLRRLAGGAPLVDQLGYFVVHAPRQTGKTTAIRALADELTASGRYAALAFTCETGRAAGDNYGAAQRESSRRSGNGPSSHCRRAAPAARGRTSPTESAESRAHGVGSSLPAPLVLFFDEIDALRGQSLISVLSQLRAGYNERPPPSRPRWCCAGCATSATTRPPSGGDPARLGTASPFNIKLKSLRLGDFTPDEVSELYAQHTAETGQEFTPSAAAGRSSSPPGSRGWSTPSPTRSSRSSPSRTSEPITVDHVEQAKERLILARATHLDSLASKLVEPRVRRVLEPCWPASWPQFDAYDDDLLYTRDLGLVAPEPPVRIANPIWRPAAAPIAERTAFEQATSPTGRMVTVLRA